MYKPWTRFEKVILWKLSFVAIPFVGQYERKKKKKVTIFLFWQVLVYNIF